MCGLGINNNNQPSRKPAVGAPAEPAQTSPSSQPVPMVPQKPRVSKILGGHEPRVIRNADDFYEDDVTSPDGVRTMLFRKEKVDEDGGLYLKAVTESDLKNADTNGDGKIDKAEWQSAGFLHYTLRL